MRQLLALTDGWSLPARYRALSPVPRGSLPMLVGRLMLAAMHAAIRHTTRHLPAVEAAFRRNVFGLLVISPLLLLRHVQACSTPSGSARTCCAPYSTYSRC